MLTKIELSRRNLLVLTPMSFLQFYARHRCCAARNEHYSSGFCDCFRSGGEWLRSSLPKPGGNITGFINVEASIAGKWVELLKEIAPRTKRVGLMFNPATATYFDYYLKPFEASREPPA